MSDIQIPLKAKLLSFKGYTGGPYTRRGTQGNTHGPKLYRKRKKDGRGHRRHCYLGCVVR